MDVNSITVEPVTTLSFAWILFLLSAIALVAWLVYVFVQAYGPVNVRDEEHQNRLDNRVTIILMTVVIGSFVGFMLQTYSEYKTFDAALAQNQAAELRKIGFTNVSIKTRALPEFYLILNGESFKYFHADDENGIRVEIGFSPTHTENVYTFITRPVES